MEAPRSERATLPRELSEFLIELSIALHRHSMYPAGHPALIPAIESVIRRAEKLLDDRPEIAFGVARRQLIIDGVTTDADQPVLRRLAEVLHRHHIGAVTLLRGMETQELGDALHALAVEADREGPLGLKPNATTWPHLRLHPLTFDGLALVDTPGGTTDSEQAPEGPGLWIGLARAALATDGSEGASIPSEPSAIAKAIERNAGRVDAYDQAIVGYLLQIARELKTASGESAEELKRRTSQLIASLNPGTLRRLVSMDGNRNQRNQFVLDATHVMAVDAVLEIVKASAEASGETISHGLVRMLTKLAAHAERGSERTRPRADIELREQVGRLLQDWRLEDPNPEAYGRVLEYLSASANPEPSRPMRAVAAEPEPLRLVQMALEAHAFGPLAERAIDEAISAGQLSGLLELIAAPPAGGQAGADLLLTRLMRPESLRGLFAGDRIDLASLNHLLPRLPLEGYEPLLEAVGSSPNRMVRRRLLDLLSRTAVDITPLIVTRLTDERWYVQRNMLTLLARRGNVPQTLSVVPWTHHPDSRVRAEAIRLQLTMPHERHLAIEAALTDRDPRIVHLGLTAIQECPPHLIERVIDLALAPDLGDESRLLAVNAIARERREDVLEALLQLSIAGRSWFGRVRLQPKSPELLAVIHALATTWPDDPQAAGVLAAAARSSDPEIRQALSAEIT
jgi:hypothetical protein